MFILNHYRKNFKHGGLFIVIIALYRAGFPRYQENIINLEFCHLLFQAWKLLKNCKTWKFNSKPGKTYFVNFVFQDVIFKIILIYVFVISALSTQTLIQIHIDLGFHCIYLEITWKIHGILCHQRSGNAVRFNTFRDFYK